MESKQLVIKRYLEGTKAHVITCCASGTVTVVTDESGTAGPAYQAALLGQQSSGMHLEYNGHSVRRDDIFNGNQPLPDEALQQYLTRHGVAAGEVDRLLQRFELKRHSYLLCSQLNPVAACQVRIIGALARPEPVVVLLDPFLPFNGRWREAFAELIVQNAKEKERIVICMNVSFLPTSWGQNPAVTVVDVGVAGQEALQASQKTAAQKKKEADALEKAAAAAARNEKYYRPRIKIAIPENVVFKFREVQDHIFAPLAHLSNFLRQWSGVATTGGIALVVLLAALVMFPNLRASRALLQTIAAKFSEQPAVKPEPPEEPAPPAPTQVPATEAVRPENKVESAPPSVEQDPVTTEVALNEEAGEQEDAAITEAPSADADVPVVYGALTPLWQGMSCSHENPLEQVVALALDQEAVPAAALSTEAGPLTSEGGSL